MPICIMPDGPSANHYILAALRVGRRLSYEVGKVGSDGLGHVCYEAIAIAMLSMKLQ